MESMKTPGKLCIDLPHIQQMYTWDCGIACILMVLPHKHREHFKENFSRVCQEEGFNKSTWTIDLCYLLRRYEIKHEFHTITLGIHPGYKEQDFYNKVLTKDESRVIKRFQTAQENELVLKESSLGLDFLLKHLARGPVILLTNARLLNCDICKLNKISSEFRKCIPWPVAYQGHYIVLCGFDFSLRRVYYRNPTFHDRICRMTLDVLEEARKSYGTDEDAILLFTNEINGGT